MGKTDISDRLARVAWWALAIIVFGLVLAIRIRLLGIPLERDEGEYAYAGQLILQGIPPYKLAYNMKFPGTYAAYALIMSLFGQTISGIHLGLLIVNVAAIALIFLVGRRLIDSTAGVAAAASYAVLSVSPSVLGLAAHATNFVILPIIGGIFLILKTVDSEKYSLMGLFAAGLLFGIGTLMKQPALLYIPLGAICIVWNDFYRRLPLNRILARLLVFGLGAVVCLGIAFAVLWRAGVFEKFWFWTVDYAWQYARIVPLSQAPYIFLRAAREVVVIGWPIWIIAAFGAVAGLWDKRRRAGTFFILGFLVFSVFALCPGFYFRNHYFVLVLPAISLLAGTAMSKLSDILSYRTTVIRFVPVLLLAIALMQPILSDKRIFFKATPVEVSRIVYPESPFSESIRIADYIREHTGEDEKIAVLGSEPQIYFYSKRHSATGYIYTYALMEPQRSAHLMQQEMIDEIQRADPMYLVSVLMNDSWLYRSQSNPLIFNWANEYTAKHYTAAGFVNITPTGTDYFFGEIPPSAQTLKNYMLIYRRNL